MITLLCDPILRVHLNQNCFGMFSFLINPWKIWEELVSVLGWKRSVFIAIPKKGNAKECSNCCTIALISHASKVMLKILQARLQQYVNCEIPDVQAGFRKGRGTRDQIANICWIMEKAREFQKNIYFCIIDYAKAFDCVNQRSNCQHPLDHGKSKRVPEKHLFLLY